MLIAHFDYETNQNPDSDKTIVLGEDSVIITNCQFSQSKTMCTHLKQCDQLDSSPTFFK